MPALPPGEDDAKSAEAAQRPTTVHVRDVQRNSPLCFRPNRGRVDELLLAAATRIDPQVTALEHAERALPAVSLDDLFPQADTEVPGRHFGRLTRRLWHLTYRLFLGAPPEYTPIGFAAKSVLLADVVESPAGAEGTAYLSVWATRPTGEMGEPVLAPFPWVPEALMSPGPDATFRVSRQALHELTNEIVDRVNLVIPAARALAT